MEPSSPDPRLHEDVTAEGAFPSSPDPFTDVDALEALEEEVVTLAAQIHAATHRLLTLIAEFDRRRGWELGGHRSCAHWLAFRTGIDLGAAREKVRAARELESLPLTSAAMARGELSFSKVRAITRVADADNEGDLVELARGCTAAQLERMVRAFRMGSRKEEAELERIRHEGRSFSVFPGDDGMYVVKGRLTAEVGALLMRAVEAASDALFREERVDWLEHLSLALAQGSRGAPSGATSAAPSWPVGSAETSTPTSDSLKRAAQRRADALALMAERAMEAGFQEGPVSGTRAARYQVVLHVDENTLADPKPLWGEPPEPGRSELEDGTRLSPAHAQRSRGIRRMGAPRLKHTGRSAPRKRPGGSHATAGWCGWGMGEKATTRLRMGSARTPTVPSSTSAEGPAPFRRRFAGRWSSGTGGVAFRGANPASPTLITSPTGPMAGRLP